MEYVKDAEQLENREEGEEGRRVKRGKAEVMDDKSGKFKEENMEMRQNET